MGGSGWEGRGKGGEGTAAHAPSSLLLEWNAPIGSASPIMQDPAALPLGVPIELRMGIVSDISNWDGDVPGSGGLIGNRKIPPWISIAFLSTSDLHPMNAPMQAANAITQKKIRIGFMPAVGVGWVGE